MEVLIQPPYMADMEDTWIISFGDRVIPTHYDDASITSWKAGEGVLEV